jgi:hypothetical protein
MTNDEYQLLLSMVRKLREAALIVSTELDVRARMQKDPHVHSIFHRWHRALHDCALGLGHILADAPKALP